MLTTISDGLPWLYNHFQDLPAFVGEIAYSGFIPQVHFKSYNEKFGKDGIHERLEWSEHEVS